jgi:hypothetical protein
MKACTYKKMRLHKKTIASAVAATASIDVAVRALTLHAKSSSYKYWHQQH